MSDLVTALRRRSYEMDRQGTYTTNRPTPALLTEAADEIDRLQNVVAACDQEIERLYAAIIGEGR